MKKTDDINDRKNRFCSRILNFLRMCFSIYANRRPDIYKRGGKLPEGGNLILANHVTKLDQFFIAMYYEKDFLRFVSGENVFRVKLFRLFIEKCLNVIIHMRGVSSMETIREMTKSLKHGDNVMIFPSGTTTFSGKSQKIDASIAKLAKMSSCNLVLLKIHGGYLLKPRWSITTRKGQIELTEFVLSKDELKNMSAKEVADVINEKLYVDAYEDQERLHIKYTGKQMCKGLESCIYQCPKCGKITGLKSNDSDLLCDCGFSATYDEYGYLNDTDGNKYTITQLCDSQKETLKNKFLEARENNKHEFLFGDDFELKYLYHNGKRSDPEKIRVNVYSDVIEYSIGDNKGTVNYEDVESIFVYLRNTIDVHVKKKEYGFELQGDFSSNALKYRDLYQIKEAVKLLHENIETDKNNHTTFKVFIRNI